MTKWIIATSYEGPNSTPDRGLPRVLETENSFWVV